MSDSERKWPARRAFRLGADTSTRADLDAELRFHIEGRIEELMRSGMSRADAEAEARRRFGDQEQIEAELRSIATVTHRQQTAREWWSTLTRDMRFAF